MPLVVPAVFVVINANAALCLRLLDVSWFPDNESPWIFWIYFLRYLLQGITMKWNWRPASVAKASSMRHAEIQAGIAARQAAD